jgi:broad specificity phosphatase PhoE
VWTSTLQRTISTAANLPFAKLKWKALDEIDAGICDGMTYGGIAQQYPAEFEARKHDKLRYRCVCWCAAGAAGVEDGVWLRVFRERQHSVWGQVLTRTLAPACCRYPRGESYLDLVQRLEPVISEIEREGESICIVSHQVRVWSGACVSVGSLAACTRRQAVQGAGGWPLATQAVDKRAPVPFTCCHCPAAAVCPPPGRAARHFWLPHGSASE